MTTTPSLVEALEDVTLRLEAFISACSQWADDDDRTAARNARDALAAPPAPYCARCGSTARSDTALTDTVVLSGREYAGIRAALEAICGEFAQGHPLIKAGWAALGHPPRDGALAVPPPVADSTPPIADDAELAAIRERCEKAKKAHPRPVYEGRDEDRRRALCDIPTLLSRIDAERARAERAEAEVERLSKRLNTIIAGWKRPRDMQDDPAALEQKEPSR